MSIEEWLRSLNSDTYPENPSELHNNVTRQAMDWVLPQVEGKQVLDIGCGQGVALEEFAKRGYNAIGTGVNETDLEACRAKGLSVIRSDMHDNDASTTFDLIWARHVLEHSPIPLYVIHLLKKRLNPHGILYIEVPMPDTICHHETNRNHYSCFTESGWANLLIKAGFNHVDAMQFRLEMKDGGTDLYIGFLCKLEPNITSNLPTEAEIIEA